MTDPANELVDILDDDGAVVGHVTRAEVRARNLWHRAVYVVVFHPDRSEVLVHRRADWKDIWPGAWDLAFGGVLGPGEAWLDAAVRELAEEAGVVVDPAALVDWGGDRYDGSDGRIVGHVYRVEHGGPVTCADGEVSEVRWVPVARLAAFCEEHTVCPDTRQFVVARIG